MKTINILIILMGIGLSACQNMNVSKWSGKRTVEWFKTSPWQNELTMKPDSSINMQLFVEQNKLNPKSWAAAFKFLKESDLKNMPVGRYDLLDDGTYASVSDYTTKDPETAYFEAHRKFIDIQYVANGEEYIYVKKMDDTKKIHKSYVEKQDIEFFSIEGYNKLLAKPDVFFVFFPIDAHKPCLKTNKNALVRKIVLKIPFINKFD